MRAHPHVSIVLAVNVAVRREVGEIGSAARGPLATMWAIHRFSNAAAGRVGVVVNPTLSSGPRSQPILCAGKPAHKNNVYILRYAPRSEGPKPLGTLAISLPSESLKKPQSAGDSRLSQFQPGAMPSDGGARRCRQGRVERSGADESAGRAVGPVPNDEGEAERSKSESEELAGSV